MANRADQRNFHYIYKITRTDGSGKYYIGMHSTDDLEDGYFGSGMLLWKSINKHGREKHIKEILEYLPTRAVLKLREKELVNVECLADEKCMNLQLGGGGGFCGEEHRRKFIAASKVTHQGNNHLKHTRGEKRSKMVLRGVLTRKANGTLGQSFSGKSHTEETKQKMRQPKNQGEKNSQFGTCWVTNGVKPFKIKKEQLSEYLFNGYSQGRSIRE